LNPLLTEKHGDVFRHTFEAEHDIT
jgi:hypothetical protein